MREPQGVVDYRDGDVNETVAIEPKYDDWRGLSRWVDGVPKLYSRNGLELPLPHIQRECAMIQPRGMFFDGALVHPDGFEAMKSAIARKDEDIHYHVFDMVDEAFFETGLDARTYLERNYTMVETIGKGAQDSHVHHIDSRVYRVSEIMDANAAHIELGYEGSVVKRLDSPYESGATGDWMRIKPVDTADCVIIGVERSKTDPSRASSIIVRDADGITTNVHAGLSMDFLRDALLHPARLMDQVVEIEHRGKYDSGKMRDASFVRMRPDKTAGQITQGMLV